MVSIKKRDLSLTLLALVTGGLAPISMLLISSQYALPRKRATRKKKVATMHLVATRYVPYILFPSLVFYWGLFAFSHRRYPRLANRMLVGQWTGLIASMFLDAFRLLGIRMGWIPFNMPPTLGKIILGPSGHPLKTRLIGYVYHYLIGGGLGTIYTLLAGKGPWQQGIWWGIFVWLGMMLSPPLRLMRMGYFGLKKGIKLPLATLIGHLVYGGLQGVLTQRFVRE